MLPCFKTRLRWLRDTWFPRSDKAGGKIKLLDIGRYDQDRERVTLLTGDDFDYACLQPVTLDKPELPAANPHKWQAITDASIDVLVSTNALEHVKYPWLCFAEMARTLKPGGRICLVEAGMSEKNSDRKYISFNKHAYLSDYYRFSPGALAGLAEYVGLRPIHVSMNMTPLGADQAAWFSQQGLVLLIAEKPIIKTIHKTPEMEEKQLKIPTELDTLRSGFEYSHPTVKPSPSIRKTGKTVLVVLGGCGCAALAHYLKIAAPAYDVRLYLGAPFVKGQPPHFYDPLKMRRHIPSDDAVIWSDCRHADRLFISSFQKNAEVRNYVMEKVSARIGSPPIFIPSFSFAGYHPDSCYGGPRIYKTRTHASRIVFVSYLRKYTEGKTLSLFTKETYRRLGYFQAWQDELTRLNAAFSVAGLDLAQFLPAWLRTGEAFMVDESHPKDFVVADVARELCHKHSIDLNPNFQDYFFRSTLENVFPIYTEIAEYLNIPDCGSYRFKSQELNDPDDETLSSIGLEEFINKSYLHFSQFTDQQLISLQTQVNFRKLEAL